MPEVKRRGARIGPCPCCGRHIRLTFHHLIPKKLHRRTRFKREFTKAQLSEGIYICRQCHSGIHDQYDEMTLAQEFDSLQALLADEGLQRHFKWVSRQKSR